MINEKLKISFGKLSSTYDKVRPDYPKKLIEDIIKISKIPVQGKILEIGAGTGKATRPFAEKGYKITALDISEKQIAIARKNLSQFSNVSYIISAFEEADFLEEKFNLIFAAQAFHWIDPEDGYKKANELLKNHGYLALFFNSQAGNTKLEQQASEFSKKSSSNNSKKLKYEPQKTLKKQLEESSLFKNIKKIKYTRNIEYTKKKYLDLVGSFSWVSTLPPDKKNQFFMELKKTLKGKSRLFIPTKSILLIAEKK